MLVVAWCQGFMAVNRLTVVQYLCCIMHLSMNRMGKTEDSLTSI